MSENLSRETVEKLIKVTRLHKSAIDLKVQSIGIHRTQHRILMHLSRCDSTPSQKELAERLDVTPAAVTLALKSIEEQGFIKRKLGKDTRFNEIMITDKGREIVKLTRYLFGQIDEALFEGVNEEEIIILSKVLSKMRSNLEGLLINSQKGEKI